MAKEHIAYIKYIYNTIFRNQELQWVDNLPILRYIIISFLLFQLHDTDNQPPFPPSLHLH